jgi:hypothetical protein
MGADESFATVPPPETTSCTSLPSSATRRRASVLTSETSTSIPEPLRFT